LRIELNEEIDALRIDPAEFPCLVKVMELTTTATEAGDQAAALEQPVTSSNGFQVSKSVYFYSHDDPQLILAGLPRVKKLVTAVYLVDTPDKAVFEELGQFFDELSRKREKERLEAERRASRGLAGRILDGIIRKYTVQSGI
ncbi:MAG: hypothetical protein IJ073_07255, partial [Lachnospiraceae bacterium]|nr:hypothetical protein [Lachnospiraceae bacterium]